MDLKALLKKLKEDKSRIMINCLGSGETRGLITEVQDDYIVYELCDAKKRSIQGKRR